MVDIGLIWGSVGTGMMPTQPILAQVNFGGTWSSFLGIALAGSGVSLYALRSMRPRLARDHDIFFAAVALLCGGILFFQGWRQDPILQFGQFLLTGSAIFFAVESIRLRGIATEQAKRSSPIVDDERPVSQSYRAEYTAELDELNPYEERPTRRRIQGSRDTRPSRDEFEDEDVRPRRSTRTTSPRTDDRLGAGERRRKPRPRPEASSSDYADFTDASDDLDRDRPPRSRSSVSSRSGNPSPGSTRPRRPRPSTDESIPPRARTRDRRAETDASSSEYVDYRPIDDDEEDNWG